MKTKIIDITEEEIKSTTLKGKKVNGNKTNSTCTPTYI